MKKNYIAPEMQNIYIYPHYMMAVSSMTLGSDPADELNDGDILVKFAGEDFSWDED